MKRLRSKIIKRILWFVLIVWCSGIFLNWYVGTDWSTSISVGEQVHAQTLWWAWWWAVTATDSATTAKGGMENMSLWQILNLILKVIYLLLWPLLVVAGLALDNTLVYASIFHLDAPLWKFWNMMKNFANFTLWFMVLYAIIKSILTNSWAWSAKDEKSPLGIIKKTLIAGILIQASWFLMAALIDVSTIATYAVGGLPLSILKNTDIGKQKILSVNSSIDLNKFDALSEKGSSFRVSYSTSYRSWGNIKKVELSPCMIDEWYIIGREYTDAKFRNSDIFWSGQSACVAFGNQIVIYNEFPGIVNTLGGEDKDKIKFLFGFSSDVTPWEACYYIIKIWWPTPNLWTCWPPSTWLETIYQTYITNLPAGGVDSMKQVTDNIPTNTSPATLWIQWWTTRFNSSNVVAMTISDLINKSKWFVGPLVTMYSSLLNFSQLTDTNVTTIGETSGIFLIKTAVAIALFFPLLALAAVLIARVWLLWLFIVASPFIIIKESFKDFIKMDKLDKYLSKESVIGIIFAPVITVAALSLSLIFMTALISWFKSNDQRLSTEIAQNLNIEPINTTGENPIIKFAGSSELEFKNFDWWGSLDWFSWLIVNFFAVGLLWTILFAAIKANELGKAVGAPIQSFGANVFRTLPILPIGEGGAGVGIGSAYNTIKQIPDRKIADMDARQTEKVGYLLDSWKGGAGSTTTFSTPDVDSYLTNSSNKNASSLTTTIAQNKWINEANVPAAILANEKIFYDKIKTFKDEKERTERIDAVGGASGSTDKKAWFNKLANVDAQAAFEKTIKIEKDSNLATLNTAVNDPNNKAIMADLFAYGNTEYTKDIDGIVFTITVDPDKKTYLVKGGTPSTEEKKKQ